MGYTGQTYQIPRNTGGFNHNRNIDLIPPEAMIDGSRNVNLVKGGAEKRGGTSIINSTVITGTPKGMGIHHYIKEDGNSYVLVATATPKILYDTPAGAANWGNDITNVASWTTANKLAYMITSADKVWIVDGANIPQTWNGVGNTADITAVATDWVGTNQPSGIVARTRTFADSLATARSERHWAWGCVSNPNRVYYSSNYGGTVTNLGTFTGGTSGSIEIITGHGEGVISMIEWGDKFFAFSKKNAFIVDDSAASIANWGYYPAQWGTGVGSKRLIVKVPNDLIAMAEDGDIYSVITAQEYGDYKAASLTRDSFIHEWIKDNVDLSNINDFHMRYDPRLRAIKIFVRRNATSYVDTALVYFIDRPPKDAWAPPHDNLSYASGYKASASGVVRSAVGIYKIYTTGWSDGYVWELETSDKNDNNNAYAAGVKGARLNFDDPTRLKRYDSYTMIARPEGNYNMDVDWWIDKTPQTQFNIDLSPDGSFVLGTGVLDTDVLGGEDLIDATADLGAVGKRIQFHAHNNRADEDFFISQELINFMPLGKVAR